MDVCLAARTARHLNGHDFMIKNDQQLFLFNAFLFTRIVRCALILIFCIYCRVSVVGQKFKGQTDKSEPWYGTEYSLDAIAEETLEVRFVAKKCID